VDEHNPAFQSGDASRAIQSWHENSERSLEGSSLLSVESQGNEGPEVKVRTYVLEHFASFLRHLRHLAHRDQSLLLSYYILCKTQTQIGVCYDKTQTVASHDLRANVRALVAISVAYEDQHPAIEIMQPLLKKAGFPTVFGHPLAEIVFAYAACGSFN